MIDFGHLKKENKNYAVHLVFSLRLGTHLLLLSAVCLIHALLPFVMATTVSRNIKKLDRVLSK